MRWIVLAVTAGCVSEGVPEDCDVHAIAAGQAGPGAVDCGRVALGADRTDLDACVADAYAAGEPFLAIWQPALGVDSVEWAAFASDGVSVWVLHYSGGSPVGAVVDRWVCEAPRMSDPTGSAPLECDVETCTCSTRVCGPESSGGNDCC